MRLLRSAVVLGLSLSFLALGPCSRIPGGRLTGEVASELPDDWSFVDELGTCAIETRPSFPHSVTVACYSAGGELYVGAMNGADKSWPKYVLEDSRVRYRAGDRIYELVATRILDETARNRIFRARAGAGGREVAEDLAAPAHYWIFHLGPRS